MSGFIVGQWVECINSDGQFTSVVEKGEFYRIAAIEENDVRLHGVPYARRGNHFRPVEWQVGKTYKTTLEGVTATIERIDNDGDFWGSASDAHVECWLQKTGIINGCRIEDKFPHLTPYLAESSIEPETKSQERFVIVRDDNGDYGCRDTERKETAWCTTRETAYRILFDSVAGKAHEWTWLKDDEPETKSEQIRRDEAEALKKVEAKKAAQSFTKRLQLLDRLDHVLAWRHLCNAMDRACRTLQGLRVASDIFLALQRHERDAVYISTFVRSETISDYVAFGYVCRLPGKEVVEHAEVYYDAASLAELTNGDDMRYIETAASIILRELKDQAEEVRVSDDNAPAEDYRYRPSADAGQL